MSIYKIMGALQIINIKDPIIYIEKTIISEKSRIELMKSLMKSGQYVLMRIDLPDFNITSGISGAVIGHNRNLTIPITSKPWLFYFLNHFDYTKYSTIDSQVYFMTNNSIWENYEFQSLRKRTLLIKISENKFSWKSEVKQNFFDRRGNFENITLFAMTASDMSNNIYPREMPGNLSSAIENAYEVILCFFTSIPQ